MTADLTDDQATGADDVRPLRFPFSDLSPGPCIEYDRRPALRLYDAAGGSPRLLVGFAKDSLIVYAMQLVLDPLPTVSEPQDIPLRGFWTKLVSLPCDGGPRTRAEIEADPRRATEFAVGALEESLGAPHARRARALAAVAAAAWCSELLKPYEDFPLPTKARPEPYGGHPIGRVVAAILDGHWLWGRKRDALAPVAEVSAPAAIRNARSAHERMAVLSDQRQTALEVIRTLAPQLHAALEAALNAGPLPVDVHGRR